MSPHERHGFSDRRPRVGAKVKVFGIPQVNGSLNAYVSPISPALNPATERKTAEPEQNVGPSGPHVFFSGCVINVMMRRQSRRTYARHSLSKRISLGVPYPLIHASNGRRREKTSDGEAATDKPATAEPASNKPKHKP